MNPKFKENGIIRIKISCGRSTDYTEEFWIEDLEGNQIKPDEWPDRYNGCVFQLVEKGEYEVGEIRE